MLFSTREIALKNKSANQRAVPGGKRLWLQNTIITSNSIHLKPSGIRKRFLFGYAQLRNNWRGVLPADNGKQQIRRELVSLPYLFYYNYNCPIGFLH
ncbi:hypothetical protein SM12VA4_24040 [Serratia marcescens]|nr:hypothetical protein SM12VA4_24040 [Serratia marcescens]BEM48879.1 hypothetical protein SME17J_23730 [Serratia marcescens]